jgi:hypothetical protein
MSQILDVDHVLLYQIEKSQVDICYIRGYTIFLHYFLLEMLVFVIFFSCP